MNIKILKELSKQAETECGWSEEKFAELIVRETLKVGEDYSEDFYHFKDEILKHFGVEE